MILWLRLMKGPSILKDNYYKQLLRKFKREQALSSGPADLSGFQKETGKAAAADEEPEGANPGRLRGGGGVR